MPNTKSPSGKKQLKTGPQATPKTANRKDGFYIQIAPKSISRVRQDIASWKTAIQQAESVQNPKRVKLQYLYKDILLDALLTSQIENRKRATIGASFSLKDASGNIDEESTAILKRSPFFPELVGHILDSQFAGTTLVEFVTDNQGIRVVSLPRMNILPERGILLLDETADKGIDYRNAKEYGVWLLEFGNVHDFGLLNKAVPHVLFKRFAQSCWSELCEIYGIPPRYIKTNTQDPSMLSRAETMMRDMGAAAWFIIDESEEFKFAEVGTTTGDVYNNLISMCNNENSMLISGAIIGQDTKFGTKGKENASIELLGSLTDSDKRLVEGYMNSSVLAALFKIGLLPDGLTYGYDPQEDIKELCDRTVKFMQYAEPDLDWLNSKFGVNFVKLKSQGGGQGNFQ